MGHLTVSLEPGETFIAEGGSMAWMSHGTQINARLLGGFTRALVRKVVGGESLFVGEFSHPEGGQVSFSPAAPGTVHHRRVNNDKIILTGGSFMACTDGVSLGTQFGGLKSMFSGEGLFFIECGGDRGPVLQLIRGADREGCRRRAHSGHGARRRLGADAQVRYPRNGRAEEHASFGRGPCDGIQRSREDISPVENHASARGVAYSLRMTVLSMD